MVLKKKVNRALMVLKEMKEADVKPDSMTFSYLINYCNQEEAIVEVIKFCILLIFYLVLNLFLFF